MATAHVDSSIERDDLSESDLLLGENNKKGNIIKNANYKETDSMKNKEEIKGEKEKEKTDGKESAEDDEDEEEVEPSSDPETDNYSGANNCPHLSCHNSCQNTERINNILRVTKRHKTTELILKTIFMGFILVGTAVVCFSYGRAKGEVEAKEAKMIKNLGISVTTENISILKARIFDPISKDTEEDDTETTEDNKNTTGEQGHDGRDDVDDFHFTDQEQEDKDDKTMDYTTKKPIVVSFWPRWRKCIKYMSTFHFILAIIFVFFVCF